MSPSPDLSPHADPDAELLGLDHLVIAVADLDRAVADYRALGFTVTPGGEHAGRSSINALVVFVDGSYLELIAWRQPAPDERWWRTLQQAGEGLVDHALLPRRTAAAIAAARARGLVTLTGPVDGGRLRPDGLRLQWQSARHATPDLPFLCGDVTPREWRVPEGPARDHANGAQGIAAVRVLAADAATSRERLGALFGPAVSVSPVEPGADGVARVRWRLGGTDFTLASPTGSGPAADALRDRLQRRGEGPCAFTIALRPGMAAPAWPESATHGVAITAG